MGNNVYIVNKLDSILGLNKLLKKKKYPFKVFLNGKEIKGNETIKVGDKLVNIDKIEGVVFIFQSGIGWGGVDSTFKTRLIQAMCKFYCDYKMRGKTWIILEISSVYRDDDHQARVMIDTYMHQGRRKMSEIYGSTWDNGVNLISDLYYDGNHLPCNNGCIHDKDHIKCTWHTDQISSYNTIKGQSAFTTYLTDTSTNLKNNKEEAKKILAEWIKVSGNSSRHSQQVAADFSKRNNSQHGRFNEILKNYGLTVSKVYTAGNFHVQYP